MGIISLIKAKHNFFRDSFFLSAIIEWNNLDPSFRNSKSVSVFKEKIFNFIRPFPNYFFHSHNLKGAKLITRLRLSLSQKLKYRFQDATNPLCNCGQDIESSTHLFVHCPFFNNKRHTLFSTTPSLVSRLLDCTDYDLTQTLLFGSTLKTSSNNFIKD